MHTGCGPPILDFRVSATRAFPALYRLPFRYHVLMASRGVDKFYFRSIAYPPLNCPLITIGLGPGPWVAPNAPSEWRYPLAC